MLFQYTIQFLEDSKKHLNSGNPKAAEASIKEALIELNNFEKTVNCKKCAFLQKTPDNDKMCIRWKIKLIEGFKGCLDFKEN